MNAVNIVVVVSDVVVVADVVVVKKRQKNRLSDEGSALRPCVPV
jgi:hypothetical protein